MADDVSDYLPGVTLPSLPFIFSLLLLFIPEHPLIHVPIPLRLIPMPESIPIATTEPEVPPGEDIDAGSSPKSPKSQFSKHILVSQTSH
jgi:hypothetical protein